MLSAVDVDGQDDEISSTATSTTMTSLQANSVDPSQVLVAVASESG